MSKTIVFCADGTWNDPNEDENHDHMPDPTNVYKLFTGKVRVALGFMVASNVYTTLAYFGHERLWSRIKWGMGETA